MPDIGSINVTCLACRVDIFPSDDERRWTWGRATVAARWHARRNPGHTVRVHGEMDISRSRKVRKEAP